MSKILKVTQAPSKTSPYYTPELCVQCMEERNGKGGTSFFADSITKKEYLTTGLVANVECYDCGETIVDHTGKCLSYSCAKSHGEY